MLLAAVLGVGVELLRIEQRLRKGKGMGLEELHTFSQPPTVQVAQGQPSGSPLPTFSFQFLGWHFATPPTHLGSH